jgi:hypothetical protein
LGIKTVRQAADEFYRKKAHLSNASINSNKEFSMNSGGTYERVIEYFIKKNDIADRSPRLVKRIHFENVIFRNMKPATMRFYFRSLRAWWNKLLEWGVAETDYLAKIKSDLLTQKDNVRPKMMSERSWNVYSPLLTKNISEKAGKRSSTIPKLSTGSSRSWPCIFTAGCANMKRRLAVICRIPASNINIWILKTAVRC